MKARQTRILLTFALVAFLLPGCTSSGNAGKPEIWTVSGISLAPDESYVNGLIASCRNAPNKVCRDRTIHAGKGHLDGQYHEAKAAFLAGSNDNDGDHWWASVPVLNLIFATASSRESQGSKVADMSAATALLNGIRSIFRRPDDQDRILEDKGVLLAQMEDSREEVAQQIEIGLSRSLEDYTLEEALTDLQRYRAAGTPAEARAQLARLLGI